MVWTRGMDGGERLANAALHRHEKQRETEEGLDGQCQGRPDRKNIDLNRIGETTRDREVWRNLVRASSSAR